MSYSNYEVAKVIEFTYHRNNLLLLKVDLHVCDSHAALRLITPYDMRFEIELGTERIKFKIAGNDTHHIDEKYIPDVLLCNIKTTMWMSWKDENIRLGYGNIYGIDSVFESKSRFLTLTHMPRVGCFSS